MTTPVVLASGSEIRAKLLKNAGVDCEILPARIDEEALRASLEHEGARPRDVADALAEFKARKISQKRPEALVIGCDQVLKFRGEVLSKSESIEDARDQLTKLRGERHSLLSAVVTYRNGEPLWRTVGEVHLTMRPFSDVYLNDYLTRNWNSIRHAVGCYKLEEEGVRLFSKVEGDYFTVLGLPLLDVLNHLTAQGILDE